MTDLLLDLHTSPPAWSLPVRFAAPPTNEAHRRCEIFAWMGQPFSSCDTCGEPYWDHLYDPPHGGDRPLFHVKQYAEHLRAWVWAPVGKVISRPAAEAVQRRWGRYDEPMRGEPVTTSQTAPAIDGAGPREPVAQPQACLLHEDFHLHHGFGCQLAFAEWMAAHRHLEGEAARDAYAWEVEQRILANLAREHAPHLFTQPESVPRGTLSSAVLSG